MSTKLSQLARATIAGTILWLVFFAALTVMGQNESADAPAEFCEEARFLMAREITPYDLTLGGGVIQPAETVSADWTDDYYADTWSFNVILNRNRSGLTISDVVTVDFGAIDDSLDLEVNVFKGMESLTTDAGDAGYLPISAGQTISYRVVRDGAYTLVVRRKTVDDLNAGAYSFSATFPGGGDVAFNPLRDNTTNQFLSNPQRVDKGNTLIPLPSADIRIHPGAATSVSGFEGAAAQVRYGENGRFGVYINNWADRISLLGGDFAARSAENSDDERIFYLKNYGYQINMLEADFANVVDSNGTGFHIGWEAIKGVWILDDCVGIKLKDNRTFTGVLVPGSRDLTVRGELNNFSLRLRSSDSNNQPAEYRATLDWAGIAPDSETQLYNGVFTVDLIGERQIALESTQIDMRRSSPVAVNENTPLQVQLLDRAANLVLDWADMKRFALIDNTLEIAFLNEPRTTTTRSGENLAEFNSINGATHIIYMNLPDGTPGEERLLLPEAESYIEIITPAGLPAFDSTALPGEPGYMPRALNNLGGECYPINTLQEQANCPPNGNPNPANGNVWYAATDLEAYGGALDLALTRSYNSALAHVDGPFGKGWTTAYLLDYDAPYSADSASRAITPEDVARFPVGLDVTYAPRGLVTFITPSGSRHVFATSAPEFRDGILTALSMPGWTLSRDSVQSPLWELRQDSGLVYFFDRAGRLVRYGFPEQDRLINIDYPNPLNGAGELGETTPVIVTDAANLRRLELTYDDANHIVRSVLRETATIADLDAIDLTQCDSAENCFETTYTYDADGYLTQVNYADGATARYSYDDAGRMSQHDDPRAPIAQVMTYDYGDDGQLTIQVEPDDGDPFVWQHLGVAAINDDEDNPTRTVTVTDEYGNHRAYSYSLAETTLKSVGDSYTLLSETSPLTDVTPIETVPIEYLWTNGLLERINTRRVDENIGRNSTIFEYAGGAALSRIRGGYPGFSVTYLANGTAPLPQTLSFADNTTLSYTYDPQGRIQSIVDRNGGAYRYSWDRLQRPTTVERNNDLTAVDYAYNELGLTESVTQRRFTDSPDDWYTVNYTYDGLGRLIGVSDPVTGDYAINYRIDSGATVITVTDATETVTTSVFDRRGNLIETRIDPAGDVGFLRKTTYDYDALNRLIAETQWLDDDSSSSPIPVTTAYDYTPLPVLPSQPGDDEPGNRVINGYLLTVTDPLGRIERYAYDALDRIRQVEDVFGDVTRYNYMATDDKNNINGFQIVERVIQGNRVFSTTTYEFDLRWQMIRITRDGVTYDLFYQTDSTRLRAMQARGAGLAGETWDDYIGRPTSTSVVQTAPTINRPNLSVSAAYDFLGRPTRVADGAGAFYRVRYCPQEQGAIRTVYMLTENDGAATVDCNTTQFARAVTVDAAGRLSRVEDPDGTRAYDYTAVTGGWDVTVTFTDNAGELTATWQLHYNGAGDLMRWIDEYGVSHDYDHDTLGRLRRVVVDDQPEASFTYVYNAIGLLESSLDDLGRGTLYAYDNQGRMTVQQNARTADATIFGYNGGLLTTAISPLGNTATYLYNDPNDPSRLTGVIEPSGDTVQFTWDDAANNLIYTSPRGNRTTYSFDSAGALWRITDALGREHDLRYDSAGNLTQWRQTQRAANGNNPDVSVAARILTIDRPTPYQAIISSPNTGLDWSRTFEYSPLGLLESVAGQNGQPLAFDYDPLGRLTTVASSDQTWTIAYADGEPELTYTDGYGFEHILRFDALQRMVSESDMDQTVTYRYIAGRSADVNLFIDDGESTRIVAYAAGNESSRPPSVILRSPGQRTTYTYNGEGSLTDITSEACIEGAAMTAIDPQNPDDCVGANTDDVWRANERFIYDALGRPTRFIDAEQNITTFAYDDAGNLVIHQDSGDRTFNYTYDRMNRLASLTGPTGIRLLLDYDDLDRVTGICRQRVEDSDNYNDCASAGGVLERYSYDGLGRLASQTYSNVDATNDQTALLYTYDPQNEGLLSSWGVANTGGVTIVRGGDGLGLVDRLSAGNATYTIQRESRFQVAEISGAGNAESLGYQYDAQGRLAAIVTGDQTLHYAYLPDNSGYTITDDATGETISFMLDERGFLSQISGDAQFSYFLNPDGRILLVQIERGESGEPVELQLNQRGETQSVLYSQSNLLIDYVSAPSGETQRETIIGSAEFFELDAGGYIIVIGYDNDGRPLTVRVNDRESGKLLHLLTFTYDVFGQRETETRQFADGTQVNIEYEYNGVQLIERRVSRSAANERQTMHNNTPLDVVHSGSPLLALGIGLAWALRRNKRRRALTAFFVIGLLIAVTLTLTVAQQTPNGATFLYAYTERGNLASVSVAETETVCAVYAYDNANRLIAVTQGDFEQTYSYDARNRLATIGDQRLAYLGDSNTLLGVYDEDGGLRLTGHPDGTPPIFQTDGDATVDLLNDGRRNILATVSGDDVSVPIRIFDPLGRYLPLTLETPDSNNPCAETSVPPELAALAPVQVLPNGMIWDAATNLHIVNGRAYSPSIGRYLQRDPQGPDAFGAIYNFPSRQTTPPVRQRIAPYADGLIRLRAAMNAIQTPTTLTASAVAQSQYPGYDPHDGESLYSLLNEVRRTTDERLQRQLDLPVWLTNHYSLPAPSIDANGALRMSTISAPGLGGTGEPFIETKTVFDPADDWLPILNAPALRLQGLMDISSATIPELTLYEPFQWRPMLPELADGWEIHTPQLGRAYTPSAVMDFVPQTLSAPQDAVAALNAVAALIELPYRNGETWLDSALDSTLPTLPVLPPADSDAWLSTWFSRDTFGLGGILDQRWANPPSAELPIYHLGANADWTLSRHR